MAWWSVRDSHNTLFEQKNRSQDKGWKKDEAEEIKSIPGILLVRKDKNER